MFKNGKMQWRQPGEGKESTAVFMGDYCPRNEGQEIIGKGEIASVFTELKPFISSSDLKIIQWETPLTETPCPIIKSGPNLNCIPESAAIITELGIDVALMANNHTGDQGDDAIQETIDRLHQAGAKTVGAGKNLDAANQPLCLECNGIKIIIMNYAENEFGIAQKNKPGSAPLSVLKNIKAIRENLNKCDQVWVTLHGGHESNPFPSPRMQETFRAFAEAGASLVFNCHTHCPEGIEVWNGVPIIYSPGNFYFPGTYEPQTTWWTGYLPKVFFDRQGVYAIEIEPFRFDNYKMFSLKDEDRDAFFAYMEEISKPLSEPELLQQYFEAWSTVYGAGYLGALVAVPEMKLPEEPTPPETLAKWMRPRNLFTCEAHNNMIQQLLRLVEEQRVGAANSKMDYIKGLQRPPWLAAK